MSDKPIQTAVAVSPEGLRAIKVADALWDELVRFIPLGTISQEEKLKAIMLVQERLLSSSVDSLARTGVRANPAFPVVQSRRASQGAKARV